MPFLSIELGKHRFKVLALERTKESLTVLHDLTLTVLPNEDFKARVTESLRDFIHRFGITDHKVFLTLSDPGVIMLRNTVLPVMASSEIVPALQWHAKEEGLFGDDAVLFNYEIVHEFIGADDAKKWAVTFSIVNKKLLDASMQLLAKLGLEVIQVTAAPLNTAKVLAGLGEPQNATVVLDLGFAGSTLAIYFKGKLLFLRTLSISYARVRSGLNDAVFLGPKFRTPDAEKEIDQAIATLQVPQDAQAAGGLDRSAGQFFSLLRPLLETLVREIRYSTNYFTANLRLREPQRCFLTGHATKLRGLSDYLSQELGMAVSKLPWPESVRFSEDAGECDAPRRDQCVSAVAGVLPGGSSTVDFIPFEIKCRKAEAYQRSFLRVLTVVVASICLIAFLLMQFRIASLRDHVKIQEKYLSALGRFAEISQKPFVRFQLARMTEEGTIPPDKALRLIGHLIPAGLSLREWKLDSSERIMTFELETSGVDEDGNPMVTDFVRRLKETKFFKSIRVKPVAGYAVSVYRVEGVFSRD